MRFLPRNIDIDSIDGFDGELDIFDRRSFGMGLATLLSESEDPLVLMLDAPWGTGKTTFVHMWKGHLKKNGFPVVYFDAFENDYVADPFAAIGGEIISLAKSSTAASTPVVSKVIEKTKAVGKVLLRSGMRIGLKAATLGALDGSEWNTVTAVAADAAQEGADALDEYLTHLFEQRDEDKKLIEEFKKSLSQLATCLKSSLDVEQHSDPVAQRPLVVIIDELDRCRPNFALALIERIKHFYSVPNIHFVLIAHGVQLENSVRYSYGQAIDAETYLQKFYSIKVTFPHTSKNKETCKIYLSYLRGQAGSGIAQYQHTDNIVIPFLEKMNESRPMSLRNLEKIIMHINLAIIFGSASKIDVPIIMAGLCYIRVFSPSLYEKLRRSLAIFEEVAAVLFFPKEPDVEYIQNNWECRWWMFYLVKDLPEGIDWDNMYRSSRNGNFIDREEMVSVIANRVVDRFALG